jgi:Domain of unknown function (DUF4193)
MSEETEDLETSEDEETVDEDVALDDLEPTADDLAEGTITPEPGLGDVESIQDILAKQESREEAATATEEDEEEATAAVATKGDERLDGTDSRIVPIQETEFTCRNCFLVKHRSQLADKKKMLCRDCA